MAVLCCILLAVPWRMPQRLPHVPGPEPRGWAHWLLSSSFLSLILFNELTLPTLNEEDWKKPTVAFSEGLCQQVCTHTVDGIEQCWRTGEPPGPHFIQHSAPASVRLPGRQHPQPGEHVWATSGSHVLAH